MLYITYNKYCIELYVIFSSYCLFIKSIRRITEENLISKRKRKGNNKMCKKNLD